ncbi:MAG: sigma-70 family RNA polymerase sigma factor [Acidobacteriota bacterium]|nr:sigma-70 family RNA polymerase sigma factor [Acidobacteriota bacterium]
MEDKGARGAVTDLLLRWRGGDEDAVEGLMQEVYPELRRLAAGYLRSERRDHTLQPTALVHEAYLRLAGSDVNWQDRVHFLAVAATIMRRVLVDHAKAKKALKRGGERLRVTWIEDRQGAPGGASADGEALDVLALDDSLRRLAELDERKSRIVELHFFGGMTYEEAAEAEGVSPATVSRELRFAKAWLLDDLKQVGT